MNKYVALLVIVLPTQLFAEQYICRSVGTSLLSDQDTPRSYIDFEDSREWIVDSEQGWKEIFPSYAFVGSCNSQTDPIDNIQLLKCSAFLSSFVINLSGMTFAYTDILAGNSVTYPSIESAVGKCELVDE